MYHKPVNCLPSQIIIMLFPSISVHLSLHEDPTSLGLDVFPLKLHGEFFQYTPSMLCPRFSKRLRSFHLLFVTKNLFSCFSFLEFILARCGKNREMCFLLYFFCSVSVSGFAVWLLCIFLFYLLT